MAVSIAISITQNSQNVANNTSNVTVKVTASWTGGSYNAVVAADGTPQAKGTVKIDGTSYSFASTFNDNQTSSGSKTIFSKTLNITHASNGSKTLSVSASYNTYVSSGTVSKSASKVLTTIPRKSTLSASNGTLGTAQTLTVTKKASSFTHTITYKCGSTSGTICTKSSSTSISWTPPMSLVSQNTTGTSVSITFTITTYSGNTNVGSNTKTISCGIPASVKPKVSLIVTDPSGYFKKYGHYIKGLSAYTVTVTASSSYGATIKTYEIVADGKKYSSNSVTTPVVIKTGLQTVSATVTDSRGRSGTAELTVRALDYSVPRITSLTATRCNEDGSANSSGDYLKVSFTGSITSLYNQNSAKFYYEYKKSSDSEYTKGNEWTGSYSLTASDVFPAEESSTYDIVAYAVDDFKSTPKSIVGPSVKKFWSWMRKGLGVAWGKVAELEGYFDIAFKTIFRGEVEFEANTAIFGTDIDGERKEVLNGVNANGNTVLGWGNYDKKSGNTNIYGYDVNIGISNVAKPTSWRPYRRQGDSLTFTIKTAGYVTNAGKDITFVVPTAVPIVGLPTITVTSNNGFVLRQGSLYTHGSTASTTVVPDSYSASLSSAIGFIQIVASFSNTTNVTNNDAIGIYWNGTITFS